MTPMGQELVLLLFRVGFLALLWLFVLLAIRAIRTDLWGAPRRQTQAVAVRPSAAPVPVPAVRGRRSRAAQRLVVTQGALVGTSVTLGEAPVTIGRANSSTLVLTDDFASAHHARLFPHGGQWFIEDVGSTNGTYLDRTRVTSPTPVPMGMPVRIGKTVLELRR
jgi:pSer/pThr/pTyr-binding forkhead associated (FHA) protein